MSGIILAGGTALGIIVLVCGLPMCCYDSYVKSQEQKRREEAADKRYEWYKNSDGPKPLGSSNGASKEIELPEKILDFKTAMKDISFNV